MLSFLRRGLTRISPELSTSVRSISSVKKGYKATLHSIEDASKETEITFENLDPEQFGNVSDKYVETGDRRFRLKTEKTRDDKDGYDKMFIKRGKKISPEGYRRLLHKYIRERPMNLRKIVKLHEEYVYEDRYIPERFWYSMMFEACGKAGQTPKALELFREMKRYELKPTPSAVTSLLNSCANATGSKQYALEQTVKLRDELQLAGYEMNDIQYNCLIKAFSMLGDHRTAYLTLEEMESKGRVPSPETYSQLLMGAIGNKVSGLLPAREIFIKLLKTGSSVKVEAFNLFLRSVRDCNVNGETLTKLADNRKGKKIFLEAGDISGKGGKPKLLPSPPSPSIFSPSSEIQNIDQSVGAPDIKKEENLPCLLTGANMANIVQIDIASLRHAPNRFQLFGGINQFERLMAAFNVKPNLKTISLLVDVLWPREFYPQIQALLKHYNLRADVMLYNIMLKRASKSNNRELCKEILRDMAGDDISPDIMTFGALTFQCSNERMAKNLLRDMRNIGATPNSKILGSLFNIACKERNMNYVAYLLDYCEQNEHEITRIDIEQIDLLKKELKKHILEAERSGAELPENFEHDFEKLKIKFAETVKRTNIRPDYDPWKEFGKRKNEKQDFNKFVKLMKDKTQIKYGKDPKQKDTPHSYYDEIDD